MDLPSCAPSRCFRTLPTSTCRSSWLHLQHQRVKEGEVLFQAGSRPTGLLLLTSGEVALKEGDEIRFRLRPVAPIGELGALTGLVRNTTAVAVADSEILRIGTAELMQFFESHGDVAFPFYHNLLRVVADKVRRDIRRMDEMRANIIRTQKAMKRMRELVLESEDTVVSKPIFESLDELIAAQQALELHGGAGAYASGHGAARRRRRGAGVGAVAGLAEDPGGARHEARRLLERRAGDPDRRDPDQRHGRQHQRRLGRSCSSTCSSARITTCSRSTSHACTCSTSLSELEIPY